ncbi:MAG: hypothetical protein QXM46_02500 [Candidatus Hadarchaeales archaeon]
MRSCWLCRWFEREGYRCLLRGKLELPEFLLERPSPCCGWGRDSSLDHVLFLRMREIAEGCGDFEPLTPSGRGRGTSPPSCRTGTSREEEGKEGA